MKKQIQAHLNELKASQELYGGVYIAIMPNDYHLYDLEVEVDPGTIGFTVQTTQRDVAGARKCADKLEMALKGVGIHVFPDRDSWEGSWAEI